MPKQIAPAVPTLPPLSSITDEATRRALQALADGWNVRNAFSGDTKERFLTEADVLGMAQSIVMGGLFAGSLPGAEGGGGVGPGGQPDDLAKKLLEYLNLPIDLTSALEHAQKAITFLNAENNRSIARILAMEDGFLSERTERISANEAFREDITGMKVSIGENKAGILEEARVRADEDGALAERITTLATTTGNNFAAVQTVLSAHTTDIEANANAITALNATVSDNTAAILEEKTVRATKDTALASQITSVVATANNKNRVFVQSFAPTASAINDLWIDTSNNNQIKRWNGSSWEAVDNKQIAQSLALVNTETQARISADSALASQITTVTSILNGNVATVQEQARAIDGIEAQWTIKTDVNGKVAGIGLINDGRSSAFAVNADQFIVSSPGVPDRIPFYIDSTGVYFNGKVSFSNLTGEGKPEAGATKGAPKGTKIGDILVETIEAVTHLAYARLDPNGANTWVRPGTTTIDGNKIYTGDAYVDTLQIKGNAVTSVAYGYGNGSASASISGGDDGMAYVAFATGANSSAESTRLTVGGGGGLSGVGVGAYGNGAVSFGGYVGPGQSVRVSAQIGSGVGECTVAVMGRMR